MSDDIERWLDQQEQLPDHLQRWAVFDRPKYIRLARILIRLNLWGLAKWVCGLRDETDEERLTRLRKFWAEERPDAAE